MRQIKLFILFLISVLTYPSNSYAKWQYVSKTIDGSKYYIETNTIIKKNELIYYWELTDYVDEGGYGYLSDVTRVVVDCELNRYKNLQITNYKGAMGTGNVTGNGEVSKKWVYPVPNSIKEGVLVFICN